MKKVVLIGKLNKTVQSLNEELSHQFQVQICTETTDMVSGILDIVKPDLIVISVMELEDISTALFDMLSSSYSEIPVLVIGTLEGCKKYAAYYKKTQFSRLVRPVTKCQLFLKCRELMNLQKDSDDILQKVDEEPKSTHKKILVVDDSALVLRNMKTMLGKQYLIGLATSGEQAIKLMEKDIPDMILLDYDMPGFDGKMTLEKIREDERLKDIPVVFLTGIADRKHIAAVLELKPAGYFLKPAERDKLLAAIDDIFYGRHLDAPEIWDGSELV